MARHMIFSASKCLLAAAVLTGAAFSGTALAACSKPEYPRQSVRLNEQGVTELAFLIRPDGTVERSIIRVSTGFPDLDRAAQEALAKCVFKPATVKGEPVQAWQPVIYSWSIVGDADMLGAKRLAAVVAQQGDLQALYRLSLLMSTTAKFDEDRKNALALLKSAAGRGVAPAQFALGWRYEKGDGVTANLEEAMRWYERAAAQGDVLAVQRLHAGAQPN